MNNLCLVHWQYTWPTFAHVCSLILFEVCLSRLGSMDRENVYTYIRAYLHAWDCMCRCGYGCALYVQVSGAKSADWHALLPSQVVELWTRLISWVLFDRKARHSVWGMMRNPCLCPKCLNWNDTWSCWTWTSCWDHEECHQSAHDCNRCQRNAPSVTSV